MPSIIYILTDASDTLASYAQQHLGADTSLLGLVAASYPALEDRELAWDAFWSVGRVETWQTAKFMDDAWNAQAIRDLTASYLERSSAHTPLVIMAPFPVAVELAAAGYTVKVVAPDKALRSFYAFEERAHAFGIHPTEGVVGSWTSEHVEMIQRLCEESVAA